MKRLIIIVLVLGVYIGSLLFKDKLRRARNAETPPTMGQIRNEKGIPVYAHEIKRRNFEQSIKVSGFINSNGFLQAEVTREVISKIEPQSKVVLEIESKLYQGKIINITQKANLYSGLYTIDIKFQELPVEVVGKVSVANITYKVVKNVIVVPRASVSQREKTPFVFKVSKEHKLVKKQIKVSDSNDDEYIVSFGIQEGDTIVTSDFRDLSENDFVFLANQEEK